ncbi:hypothetical protein N4T20_10245 [Flavobacterium sp. TR2]|uniref:hypothetical protein n=1 Tax=Flavobacterium sp. TR2 TaxID=2977321 RepID=UPI0021B098FC|nr:hypothetical protein [Flavobacterium sp. TR2]UWY30295.1 hypothetical protein N4T20_10245 [Flavobacterium sp. TR2]
MQNVKREMWKLDKPYISPRWGSFVNRNSNFYKYFVPMGLLKKHFQALGTFT